MRDFDRLLSESLKSVGDVYRPADQLEAREAFLRRARRRRWFLLAGIPATATAAAVIAALLFVSPSPEPRRPSEPRLRVAAEPLSVTVTIPVGEEPSGIGDGEGAVWVANSGDGTVA